MRYASMTQWGEAAASTRKAIVDRKEFEIRNLSGGRPQYNPFSRLPGVWRDEYDAHRGRGRIIYEVRSWATPIAWYVEDMGWVMPPIGYTSYTSRHQALVHRALRDEGIEPRTIPLRVFLGIRIDWDWEVSA